MIKINLLPTFYAEAQRKKELQILLVGFVVLVGLGIFGFYSSKKTQLARIERDIAQKQAKLQQQQNLIAQMDALEQKKKLLSDKKDGIKRLSSGRFVYPVFFADFLTLLPADVWVTDLRLTRQQGILLDYSLTAKTFSNFSLATWLTNLQQSPNFSGVKLGQINYETGSTSNGESQTTLNFQLTFSYRHAEPLPLSETN